MKIIFAATLSLLFVSSLSFGSQNKISCNDDNPLIESHVNAEFNATAPTFQSTQKKFSDGSIISKTYLSPQSVCGVNVDFAKECKGHVGYDQNDANDSWG